MIFGMSPPARNELHIINKSSHRTEKTIYYDTTETVSNVSDQIRAQYCYGSDVQIVLFLINGLDQDEPQIELKVGEPMQKYFPNGGQVYLEARHNPSNLKQGQGDFGIRGNQVTHEAQQNNIIAVQSDIINAEVIDNMSSNNAKQSNLVTDGRIDGAILASIFNFG